MLPKPSGTCGGVDLQLRLLTGHHSIAANNLQYTPHSSFNIMACHLPVLVKYSQVASTAIVFSYGFIIFNQNCFQIQSWVGNISNFFLGSMSSDSKQEHVIFIIINVN